MSVSTANLSFSGWTLGNTITVSSKRLWATLTFFLKDFLNFDSFYFIFVQFAIPQDKFESNKGELCFTMYLHQEDLTKFFHKTFKNC